MPLDDFYDKELGARIDWPADLVTPKGALAGAPVTDADVDLMALLDELERRVLQLRRDDVAGHELDLLVEAHDEAAVLDAAETRARAPFPPEDPAAPQPEPIAPAPVARSAVAPKPDEGPAITP